MQLIWGSSGLFQAQSIFTTLITGVVKFFLRE